MPAASKPPWLLPSIFGGLVLVGWISQVFAARPAKSQAKAKAAARADDGNDEDYGNDADDAGGE